MAFGTSIFIGGFVALFVSLLVGAFVYDAKYDEYQFDVMAANDGSVVQGRFGIFSGYIDEESYYFFYREYEDGRIEQGRIKESQTAIYQDQETDAFIKVRKDEGFDLGLWGIRPGYETRYEIHVPKGSVIEDVRFDLE